MGGILLCHALPYLLDLVLIVSMVRIMESEKVELGVASFVETNAIFKLRTWEWKKWCVCEEGGRGRERKRLKGGQRERGVGRERE